MVNRLVISKLVGRLRLRPQKYVMYVTSVMSIFGGVACALFAIKKKAPHLRGSNGRNEEGWTTFTADHLLVLDAVECDVPHIRIGPRRDGAGK